MVSSDTTPRVAALIAKVRMANARMEAFLVPIRLRKVTRSGAKDNAGRKNKEPRAKRGSSDRARPRPNIGRPPGLGRAANTRRRLPSAAERTATLARALRTFLRFVDAQRTAIHVEAVQALNGGLRLVLRHVDETEAAGLSSFAVIDELDRVDLPMTLEEASDVLLCGVEGRFPT